MSEASTYENLNAHTQLLPYKQGLYNGKVAWELYCGDAREWKIPAIVAKIAKAARKAYKDLGRM